MSFDVVLLRCTMTDNLKSKVVKGTFWALMERLSGQVLLFGVGIILARLLSPTDYGTVALLGIFTAIAGRVADSGFGDALIQKKMPRSLITIRYFIFRLC